MAGKIQPPNDGSTVFTVAVDDMPVNCLLQNAADGVTIAAASYEGPNDPAPVDIQPSGDGKSFEIPKLAHAEDCYTINVTLSGAVGLAQVVEDCPDRTILITIAGLEGNCDLQVN